MIFRGREDLDLSDHGHLQAAAVADHMEPVPLEAVYSSPMRRAMQTARPLAERKGLEIIESDEILDADFGAWQGLTVPQVQERFPELFELWEKSPHKVTFPGGERFGRIAERTSAGIQRIARELGDGAAAVVSHRFINKVVLCWLLDILEGGFWKIMQNTACINEIVLSGPTVVIQQLNYTGHLAQIAGSGREPDF